MKNNKHLRLVESGVMIALGTVLSLLRIQTGAQGGSITFFSLVPLLFIAFRYGVRWGIFTGMVYGLLQIFTDGFIGSGYSLPLFLGSLLLDYLLAFGCIGLAGFLRKLPIKNQTLPFVLGTILALSGRFLMHFISGFLLWSSITEEGFGAVIYSLIYNFSYMGPELLVTLIGVAALGGIIDLSGKEVRFYGR